MKCPKCQLDNREGAKFCKECGHKIEVTCPHCGVINLPDSKFCDSCGKGLEELLPKEKPILPADSERKHVTVLLSDMSAYTAMVEKLDPEEVKEIMGKIFGEISKVVSKYEGFIEKFAGDAVMALFGVPKAHEDDPVRAIKVAREINEIVSSISPQYEERIGKPLAMHSGICTGLVVTGEVNPEKGTHGVLGDTINLASRLSGLAKPGEIVVGLDTYHQAEGYFNFELLELTTVKGKTEPIRPYKVLLPRQEPAKTHRLSGLRAELIGRKVEMAQLQEAVQNLKQGKMSIFSIVGDAGTGKSRLIEEFKASLDLNTIQWREGHCYAYAQNIPYFPLIDLLNKAYQIQEGDPPEQVRRKVESGTRNLVGDRQDLIPYVGSLYSLSYPEIEGVSPEFWKIQLHEAILTILSALTQTGPIVVCLEDLQWDDLSSIELLRNILSEFRYTALLLCLYRPPFSLFTSHQASSIKSYHEIRLYDLSTSEAQDMVESLLKAKDIPPELRKFIQARVEGNPFYLEEAVNALIESETLVREDGSWKLTRSLLEANIPSTVQGIISARLDRLERETKRILQEASVIGRAFLYEILNRISELKEHIERSLTGLERLDLIRVRSLQPELEYIFKHALTQEVVYNGILKKERQMIHERIGLVIEGLFFDRLPEFHETLAFHFKQGHSILKAVYYLIKAGEKSLSRYALDESDQYFREGFDIMVMKNDRTIEENRLLVDILLKWMLVFYYRGDFKEMSSLLSAYQELAESLNDRALLGIYYVWMGMTLMQRENFKDAYYYLNRALKLGDDIGDPKIVSSSSTWLAYTCADLGLLEEAVTHGQRALEIGKSIDSTQYPYHLALGAMGYVYWVRGESKKADRMGEALLEYGQKHSNIRSTVFGHWVKGFSFLVDGDFPSAIECNLKAINVSADPWYTQFPKLHLGLSYAYTGQFKEAMEPIEKLVSFCDSFGGEILGTPARVVLGAILVAKGQMAKGLKIIESVKQLWLENGCKWRYSNAEYLLGTVFLKMVDRSTSISFPLLQRNVGFLIRYLPFARNRAEHHFLKAIEVAEEIGAMGMLGHAYYHLGLLHKLKRDEQKVRDNITKAIYYLEKCQAETYLGKAKEVLAALKDDHH
jgi:class 3 adenylate cyclase/tetratricopeptide (TPR) repeat protein